MSYTGSKYIEDDYLSIAMGHVRNTSYIDKFGYNSAVGNSFETVWDGNNVYTYIATAGTAVAASSSTDDNGGTVEVSGLDANFNEISEILTIGGSAGTKQFYRVSRARMVSANTGDTNVGNVTITVDSKSAAIITAGYGQTLMALYTVPAKCTGYLVLLDIGCSKDLEHEVKVIVRSANGGAWNTKAFITTRGGFIEKNWKIPLEIPEKSDIEVRAKGSATTAVSAGFELVTVKR